MNILVTGGAGYIGSHVVRQLIEDGGYERVVVYDNLSKGHSEAVKDCIFIKGDLQDRELMESALKDYMIDSVIHLAADSLVEESMKKPRKYFMNNVLGGMFLLDAMLGAGVKNIVFSSTAAVYGEPERTPITEDAAVRPTSTYGESKLFFETILKRYGEAYGLNWVSLRYFNAAGAHVSGEIGEAHDPETHLIPIVLESLLGKRESVTIYGTDYPTEDGTCVRDYIHVMDLASAHILALRAMEGMKPGSFAKIYNIGNGNGFSVREVIEAVESVTGLKVNTVEGQRRPGDPAVLVASSERLTRELGWKPVYNSLDTIIETAWRWHKAHPNGDEG